MNSSNIQETAVRTTSCKVLEVIVKSREEAREAELYGADRLEIIRSPESGGLTPELNTVRAIVEAVSLPVRVMIRERDSMEIADGEELLRLQETVRTMATLPIDGLVLGFVAGSVIDTGSLERLLSAAPHCRVTFHRAFESVQDPVLALQTLKQFRQIDRVLVRLGDKGERPQIDDLVCWQRQAAPEIQFIAGLGLNRENILRVQGQAEIKEVHVGRLLREPVTAGGRLSRQKFLDLKSTLG